MYPIVLSLHNVLRWVVLLIGIFAAVRAASGWFQKREWSDLDRKVGLYFTIAMDIQILLGLLLYLFFSPITTSALRDFGAAMGIAGQRYFALEHVLSMALALVFAHLGSALPKRTDDPVSKYRRATIWFTLAVLLIILGMPWMRPLFPGIG